MHLRESFLDIYSKVEMLDCKIRAPFVLIDIAKLPSDVIVPI